MQFLKAPPQGVVAGYAHPKSAPRPQDDSSSGGKHGGNRHVSLGVDQARSACGGPLGSPKMRVLKEAPPSLPETKDGGEGEGGREGGREGERERVAPSPPRKKQRERERESESPAPHHPNPPWGVDPDSYSV